jgi:prophage regulatory protein
MRMLSEQDLEDRGIKFCRMHRHRLVKAGKFPPPVKIGENTNAWVESEIDNWLAARVQERDRALVPEAA